MTDPVNLSISPQGWAEETTENNSLQSMLLPKYWFIMEILIITEKSISTHYTLWSPTVHNVLFLSTTHNQELAEFLQNINRKIITTNLAPLKQSYFGFILFTETQCQERKSTNFHQEKITIVLAKRTFLSPFKIFLITKSFSFLLFFLFELVLLY